MIQWVNHSAIDKQKWDNCIANCPWGNIYATYSYLNAVTNQQWMAMVIGDYELVMPVAYKKKLGIEYAYRPNFCQQLGYYSADGNLSEESVQKLYKELYSRFIQIHYPLNHANIKSNEQKFEHVYRSNFILTLNKKPEEIEAAYHPKLKKTLQKGIENGLEFSKNITSAEVAKIYKDAWNTLNPIEDKIYKSFSNHIDESIKSGLAINYAVFKGKEILAACTVFKYNKRLFYPFSGITTNGRKQSATVFLIHSILMEHANSDYTFDFEGSDIGTVQHFYKKFRPINEPYILLSKESKFNSILRFLLKRRI